MAGYRNEPLDTLIELGREQSRMMMIGGATLVLGVFGLIGVLGVAGYLEQPKRLRECVTSVERDTHFSTDLCNNRCFRDNYLRLQQEYHTQIQNLELPQGHEIDYIGLAYRRARETCKND